MRKRSFFSFFSRSFFDTRHDDAFIDFELSLFFFFIFRNNFLVIKTPSFFFFFFFPPSNTNKKLEMTQEIRDASTIIVASRIPGEEDSYRILFVKRHKKARFFPSAHVFPGGVVEKSDRDIKWRKRITSKGTGEITTDEMFRIAGIRELFEESNILYVKSTKPIDTNSPTIKEWRKRVQKDSSLFLEMSEALDFYLDTQSLYDWARWITPEFEKYRYDTYFFFALLDEEQAKYATHCEQETVAMEWLTPKETLHRFKEKELYLAPPTWINVVQLLSLGGLGELVEHLEGGERSMEPILPQAREGSMEMLLFGDKELGGKEEHRAVVDMKDSDIEYRFQGKKFVASKL